MSSCSPPARGRGTSRMPGSAEHVGSPAPQVTDRATKNRPCCPTRPGADSLHPCPSRRPAPHRVPRTGPNPSPPPPSSSQRWLGSPNYRAQQAPRETQPALGRRLGAIATTPGRQDDDRAEAQRPQRGRTCRTGPIRHPGQYQAERCVARHTSAPSAPLRETPSSPSRKGCAVPRLPTTTYRPFRPLPRALRVTFHRPPPKSHPEPTHSRVCP